MNRKTIRSVELSPSKRFFVYFNTTFDSRDIVV